MLLLGQDADRDVEPVEELVEPAAEQPAPVLADEAKLADERVGRPAGRLTEQVEERHPVAVAVLAGEDDPGLVPLERLDRGGEARRREAALVDEGAKRGRRRIVVREVDQEEVLEAGGRRPVDPGERRGERAEQGVRPAPPDVGPDARQRRRDRRIRTAPRGLHDREVGRLVEQAQGEELARQWLPPAGFALRVQPPDDRPGEGRRERPGPDVGGVEAEPGKGVAAERDSLHVPPSLARPDRPRTGWVSRRPRPRGGGWRRRARSSDGGARSRPGRTRTTSDGLAPIGRSAGRGRSRSPRVTGG